MQPEPEINFEALAYSHIAKAAAARKLLYYGELMEAIGLSHINPQHRGKLAEIMHNLCAQSFAKNKFMICSIVVSKGSKKPSTGFFNYAESLGILKESDDRKAFLKSQKELVFSHYAG
ncbi:MAG: hypothetical protein COV36_07040 [Alphaproteobacteria bacterium CG11_big_fil_rev_8_21_14_0_20_44_7]|nr:MAG: hypothetical protein COV36_07040 [Alphaproteobacteria bacterium CG11_big_fil_rev_8_21_14_0_20_44_7]